TPMLAGKINLPENRRDRSWKVRPQAFTLPVAVSRPVCSLQSVASGWSYKPSRGLDDMLAIAGLLFLSRRRVHAFVKPGFCLAAVPTEFCQDYWFARARDLADDSFEVRQVRQLILLLSIFVAAALRRIKVDLKEIEEPCLPLRAETRIPLNPTPISRRDRRLQ